MSKKKQQQTRKDHDVIQRVFLRAGGRREVTINNARCDRRATDPHHVIHQGDGGATTLENVAALCRRHHDRHHFTEYARGKLLITSNGDGTFQYEIKYAADKFEARGQG